MPGGRSYRPGDIITALNGKTIEVTNTDAEGRLILADALTHARRSGADAHPRPRHADRGHRHRDGRLLRGPLRQRSRAWAEEIRAAAEESGDPRLESCRCTRRYRRYIESPYADMMNSSSTGRDRRSSLRRFLQEFVGDGPWAHLDIAGTAYLERTREDYYGAPGATGYGVRLLAELARRFS